LKSASSYIRQLGACLKREVALSQGDDQQEAQAIGSPGG
jgi:hypothetical protein